MSEQRALGIKLELEPNPEGDNNFDINIKDGRASLTYLASKIKNGWLNNAGDVVLFFEDCIASKFIASEPNVNIYPGWSELESDFGEIESSQWLASFPEHCNSYHHYFFALNHNFFECIAKSFYTELHSENKDR